MTRQAAAYRDATGPAGRRRRARALPGRRAGPQHRRAGRGEPGLEAGPGGQRDVAGQPPGHLPRRAPPGRRPRAAQHDGAGRAPPPATTAPRPCATPSPSCSSMDEPRKRFAAMMSGLDIRYDLGEGHPLLGRRMPDLDLVTADGPRAGLHPAARRPAGAAQPRRARRLRHRALGGSGPAGRRRLRGRVGASGARARSRLPPPC